MFAVSVSLPNGTNAYPRSQAFNRGAHAGEAIQCLEAMHGLTY